MELILTTEDMRAIVGTIRVLQRLVLPEPPTPEERELLISGAKAFEREQAAARARRDAPGAPKAKREYRQYTPREIKHAVATVRRHKREKHPHPLVAAAEELGIPYRTITRWARAAGAIK